MTRVSLWAAVHVTRGKQSASCTISSASSASGLFTVRAAATDGASSWQSLGSTRSVCRAAVGVGVTRGSGSGSGQLSAEAEPIAAYIPGLYDGQAAGEVAQALPQHEVRRSVCAESGCGSDTWQAAAVEVRVMLMYLPQHHRPHRWVKHPRALSIQGHEDLLQQQQRRRLRLAQQLGARFGPAQRVVQQQIHYPRQPDAVRSREPHQRLGISVRQRLHQQVGRSV